MFSGGKSIRICCVVYFVYGRRMVVLILWLWEIPRLGKAYTLVPRTARYRLGRVFGGGSEFDPTKWVGCSSGKVKAVLGDLLIFEVIDGVRRKRQIEKMAELIDLFEDLIDEAVMEKIIFGNCSVG